MGSCLANHMLHMDMQHDIMIIIGSGFGTDSLRTLGQAMVSRAPASLNVDQDLVPGGDLRLKGNAWLRSAFNRSGLSKVPRENQIRFAVKYLLVKKKIGFLYRIMLFLLPCCQSRLHHLILPPQAHLRKTLIGCSSWRLGQATGS